MNINNRKEDNRILELSNARITDVINGCFFPENTSLLIQNGKILWIGRKPADGSGIKPDIVIDLRGLTVLPGLFNTHCHIQMVNPTIMVNCKTLREVKKLHDLQVDYNMEECIARGITNIRDAYTEDLKLNRQLIRRINSGELRGPRIQQAVVVGVKGGYLSPKLRGLNSIIAGVMGRSNISYEDKDSGVVVFSRDADEREIRGKVDLAVMERGADLIKVGESLEESLINRNPFLMKTEQLSAITGQARKRGMKSTIHSVSVETFRRAVSAGFSSIAHLPRDGIISTGDADKCRRAGCIIDPTLSVGYDMSWKLSGDPFCGDPGMESLYSYRNRVFQSATDEFWIPGLKKIVMQGYKKASKGKYNLFGFIGISKLLGHFSGLPSYGFKNAGILYENGLTLSCGNDGGIQSCTPAGIGIELELMEMAINQDRRDKIIDPAEIIRAATINSARSMGLEGSFGSIEAGKNADLMIVKGDPFENVSIIGKPVDALFMDGKPVIDNLGISEGY